MTSKIATIKTLHSTFSRRRLLEHPTAHGQMREAVAIARKRYGFAIDRRGRCYIPMVKRIPKGFHFNRGKLVPN